MKLRQLMLNFFEVYMKKLIIFVIAFAMLFSVAGAVLNPQNELEGKQKIPTGAPWIPDNGKIYFGDDKDGYIEYDADGTSTVNIHGMSTLLEGAGVSLDSGEDLVFEGGDSKADFSLGSGVFKTTQGAITLGPGAATIADLAAITAGSGSAAYDLSASTGAFKTSQGTNTFGGNVVVSGSKTTTTGTGLTTISGMLAMAVNATTTLSTTLTASNTKNVYGVDASGGTVTLTLPDATTVTGRPYYIAAAADMVSNNIVVATTSSGKLGGAGGADTLTSTDAAAGLVVISDGTHYLVVSKVGTWT
jgi:hypothetical protein